jgi:hypothetical protein
VTRVVEASASIFEKVLSDKAHYFRGLMWLLTRSVVVFLTDFCFEDITKLPVISNPALWTMQDACVIGFISDDSKRIK